MRKRTGSEEFRTQSIKPKFGFCLIDLQFESDDNRIMWMNGSLSSGIEAICKFIRFLKEREIPIALVEFTEILSTTNSVILDAAGKSGLRIRKNSISAFGSPQMEPFLDEHNIDTLIIGGFHPKMCVRTTALNAIERGYEIWSSAELLFPSDLRERGFDKTQRKMDQLRYYRECTSYFETLEEMKLAIERRLA